VIAYTFVKAILSEHSYGLAYQCVLLNLPMI